MNRSERILLNAFRGPCMGDAMKDDGKTRERLAHEPPELRLNDADPKTSMTESTSAEAVVEDAGHYAESILEAVREPLLVLDADLKIILANRNFYRTFRVAPSETIGNLIYDLGNKQWDIPRLRELLEEVLLEEGVFDDFEVDHSFPNIGRRIMLLNARRICRQDVGAPMILLAMEDATERKRLEETASDGIVLLEKCEGKITHANPATEKILGFTPAESIVLSDN